MDTDQIDDVRHAARVLYGSFGQIMVTTNAQVVSADAGHWVTAQVFVPRDAVHEVQGDA